MTTEIPKQDNEVIRITLASILLILITSTIFWNGLECKEKCKPVADDNQFITFAKILSMMLAIFWGFYLFLIALAYIPEEFIWGPIQLLREGCKKSAHYLYAFGIIFSFIFLGLYSFFTVQYGTWVLLLVILLGAAYFVVTRLRKKTDIGKASTTRITTLRDKIYKEYPELLAHQMGEKVSFSEIAKTYHELKDIESKKSRDFTIIVLTIINLILIVVQVYKSFNR